MKINQSSKIIVVLIMLLMIVFNNIVVYADDGLPNIDDSGYKPTVASGGVAIDKIEVILGVLTVIGVIGIVLGIAIIGFSMILGSASEKAVAQERFGGLLIASLIILGGSALASMIIAVAESF